MGTLCFSTFIFAPAKPRSDKIARKHKRSARHAMRKSKAPALSGGVVNESLSTLISEVQTVHSDKVTSLIQQAEEAAHILDEKVAKTLQNLEKSAQLQIAEMKEEVSEKTQNLKKHAEEQAQLIKLQAAKQAEDAQREATFESQELEQKLTLQKNSLEKTVLEKTKEIKRQAAETVLELISKAEQQALEAKRKAREEALLKKIENESSLSLGTKKSLIADSKSALPIPVGSEWKMQVSEQFNQDISLMRRIIIDGESKDEAADFAARFNQQQNWFDTTLQSTTYVDDANYKKIIERKNKLHTITDAQRKADAILNETVILSELTTSQQKKLRLLILYELNALVNKQPINIQQSGYLPIDKKEIIALISRLSKEVQSTKFLQMPKQEAAEVDEPTAQAIETLPDTLSPLMTISPKKSELTPVVVSEVSAEQVLPPLPTQDRPDLPLMSDITQQVGAQELDMLSAEVEELRKRLTKEELERTQLALDSKRMLENKGNKIVELEILLTQAQNNIKKFSDKISKSKQKLAQSRAMTKSTENLRATDVQDKERMIRDLEEKEAKIKKLQQSLDKAQQDIQLAKDFAEKDKGEAVKAAEQQLKNSFKSKLEAKEIENLELETLNIQYKKEIMHLQDKIKIFENEKIEALAKVEEIQKQLAQAGLQKEESSILLKTSLKNRLEDSARQNIENELEIKEFKEQLARLDRTIKKLEQDKLEALGKAQEAQKQALIAEQEKKKAIEQATEKYAQAAEMFKKGQEKFDQANLIEAIADKTLQDGNAVLRKKNDQLLSRQNALDQGHELLNQKRGQFDATVEKTKMNIDQAMRTATEVELQALTVKQKAKIEIEQARRNALKDELEQHAILDEKSRAIEKRERKVETQKNSLDKEKIGVLNHEVELSQKRDRLSKKITSQLKESLEKELLVRVTN